MGVFYLALADNGPALSGKATIVASGSTIRHCAPMSRAAFKLGEKIARRIPPKAPIDKDAKLISALNVEMLTLPSSTNAGLR